MTRPRLFGPSPAGRDPLWAELGAHFTTRPVCPECGRLVHPRLWDAHLETHHDNRVGLAEEAASPPPITTPNEEE